MKTTKNTLTEYEEQMNWQEKCTEAEDVLNIISRLIDKEREENKCECAVVEEPCSHDYGLHEEMSTIFDAVSLIRKWSF